MEVNAPCTVYGHAPTDQRDDAVVVSVDDQGVLVQAASGLFVHCFIQWHALYSAAIYSSKSITTPCSDEAPKALIRPTVARLRGPEKDGSTSLST